MSNFRQDLIVLISPPASGKTYWISKLFEAVAPTKILVISPLRALADECRHKWGETITVMTPEEWVGNKCSFDIVIFDEFHLFFYWGDSFRPLMWEVFFEISQTAESTFLLTATLSEEMKEEIFQFKTQFDSILWINRGNQILKNKPQRYINMKSRNTLQDLIHHQKKDESVKLIFCKFRNEVFQMEKRLQAKGFFCITCVGGESKFMAQKLLVTPQPDFIISTTVLSHGVNLPKLAKIFFTYKVENLDFWIQMVARGGRKGEEYQVFALENPNGIEWNRWKNFFQLLIIRIQLKWDSFFSLKSFDFS